jgi:Zn-finger nucleic acid-binding protein
MPSAVAAVAAVTRNPAARGHVHPGMSLVCPKCSSEMKSYERNSLLVDQCTGCGGLFLDKGELEHLAAAENAWHAASVAASPPAAQPPGHDDRSRDDRSRDDRSRDDRSRDDRPRDDRPRYDDRSRDDRPRYDDRSRDDRSRDDRPRDDRSRYDDRSHGDKPRYDDRRDGGYDKPRKKKSSFLSDLFDS